LPALNESGKIVRDLQLHIHAMSLMPMVSYQDTAWKVFPRFLAPTRSTLLLDTESRGLRGGQKYQRRTRDYAGTTTTLCPVREAW
jgi:hypothetical protein